MAIRSHDNDVAVGEDRSLDIEDRTHHLAHSDLRADLSNQSSDRFHLRPADPCTADTDKTGEVGLFHDIVVHEHQPTDTKMSKLKRHVRAGSAAADDSQRQYKCQPPSKHEAAVPAVWRRYP